MSISLSLPASAADRFTIGGWSGQARYDKGTFSRCTIEGEYRSGITIDFGLTRDFEVEIWLQHPDWTLAKGRTYEVEYWVDGYAHSYGELISFGGGFGRIEIRNANRTFEQLRVGVRLFVAGIGKTEIFRLDNTFVALERLRQCVELELRAERGYSNPPGYGRAPAPGYRGDDDDDDDGRGYDRRQRDNGSDGGGRGNDRGNDRDNGGYGRGDETFNRDGGGKGGVSASEFMSLVFRTPAMAKFKPLQGRDIPASLRGEEVVWAAPNAVGFANRLVGKTPEDAVQERVESDRRACGEGKFADAGRSYRLPNGSTSFRYTTICRSTETLFAHYATYPARDGSVYLIAHLSINSDAGAKAADEAIFSFISAALRQGS